MYSRKIMKLAKKLYKDKTGLFGIYVCLAPAAYELLTGEHDVGRARRAARVKKLIPTYARPYVKMVYHEEIELRGVTSDGVEKSYWTLKGIDKEITVTFPPYEEIWSQQEAWCFCLGEARRQLGKNRSLFQFFYGADHDAP